MLVTGRRRSLCVDVCVVGQLGWENFEFWRKSFCFHLSRPFRSSQRWYSLKKVFLKFFPKLTGKPLIWSLFLISCTSLTACNFIKKRLQHRCFPVNFVKFLGTPFLQDISERQLLTFSPDVTLLDVHDQKVWKTP